LDAKLLDRTFFLSSTRSFASSCCPSWRRHWTLLFWDLVKPSGHHCGHHCGLGFYVFGLTLHYPVVACVDVQELDTWYPRRGPENRQSLLVNRLTLHWLGLPADHEHWPCPPADRGRWPRVFLMQGLVDLVMFFCGSFSFLLPWLCLLSALCLVTLRLGVSLELASL
jgi:hypothetical protein